MCSPVSNMVLSATAQTPFWPQRPQLFQELAPCLVQVTLPRFAVVETPSISISMEELPLLRLPVPLFFLATADGRLKDVTSTLLPTGRFRFRLPSPEAPQR